MKYVNTLKLSKFLIQELLTLQERDDVIKSLLIFLDNGYINPVEVLVRFGFEREETIPIYKQITEPLKWRRANIYNIEDIVVETFEDEED